MDGHKFFYSFQNRGRIEKLESWKARESVLEGANEWEGNGGLFEFQFLANQLL